MINRQVLIDSFEEYVKGFDAEDERISLKILHTYKVAENCEHLAAGLELREEDAALSWAIGMLHDIGRFEQVAASGSFIDSAASDHADAGAEFLFGEGRIADFAPDASDREKNLMRLAILWHNKHQLPETLTDEELLFCRIIRDADKLDIFRVCCLNSFEASHEYPPETVQQSGISEAVIDCFEKCSTLDYSLRREPADIYLGHIALCFGLYFPESRRLAIDQGYIEQMADFTFTNAASQMQFEKLKAQLMDWLSPSDSASSV